MLHFHLTIPKATWRLPLATLPQELRPFPESPVEAFLGKDDDTVSFTNSEC